MSSTTPGIAPPAQADGTRHRGGVSEPKGEGTPHSVIASIPTLGDGGGAQKTADEHFQVDGVTGSLTTEFGIRTSHGRGSFGPNLTLTYDSGSGNGPFGLGWNLTGLSAISRKTSTQIPQYLDDSDVFVLSGADDLVRANAESKMATIKHPDGSDKMYTVQIFRPRTDDLSKRIERWTRQDDPTDVHWRVISQLNHCSIYGWSDNSRIVNHQGRTRRIFSWLPCRSYDTRGNAIEYAYHAEDGIGGNECLTQKYLKCISYGNLRPARDMDTWDIVLPDTAINDWGFEVVLDYHAGDPADPAVPWDARKDPFSRFNAGFEVRTSRLCRRIRMVHNFPNESPGGSGIVVSTTEIAYHESAKGSFITSLTRCGYSDGGVVVHREPPYQFEYSSTPMPDTIQPRVMPGVMQTNASLGGGKWLELEGEGAPGYLTAGENGRWTYQRNLNAAAVPGVTFAAPLILSTLPSEAQDSSRTTMFLDLDQNGSMDVLYFDDNGRAEGFAERIVDNEFPTWRSFEPFYQVPTMPFSDGASTNCGQGTPRVQMLDLTGNGLQDLLLVDKEMDEVVWYECLAKVGYGPAVRRSAFFGIDSTTPPSSDEGLSSSNSISGSSESGEDSFWSGPHNTSNTPWIVSGQPDRALFAADMTGDGLADLVLVSNSGVVFWPNMGYGRFGRQRVMTNAPMFDKPDQFTTSRLVLADVDGTGTTDVLYLPAGGGVDIYYNCLGNSWDNVTHIESLPAIDQISSVSAFDILGDGTSCLVWTGPDSGNESQSRIWYLPLMNGIKPHLMIGISNGTGLETKVQYRPSTFFRQRDFLASRPWRNGVPSAMHCVSEVLSRDDLTTVETRTSYAYHDGFYDYYESTFGGFGMAEITRAKRVPLRGQLFETSRTLTKTWFHTGDVSIGRELFHATCPPRLDAERRYGDVAISNDNPRNVYRALRGKVLRQELYDTATANARPVAVEESTFALHLPEPNPGTCVFAVFPAESVRTEYSNRDQEEPRIAHSVTAEVDEHGNVTKSLAVSYGKTKSHLPDAADRAKQEETVIMATANRFTPAFSDIPGAYTAPRQFETATWRVFGVQKPASALFSPQDLAKVFDYSQLLVLDADESAAVMQKTASAFPAHKVLVSCIREQFRNDKLDNVLPLGTADLYAVTDRTYQLCLTPSMVNSTYLGKSGFEPHSTLAEAGYVDLDGDGHWWIPSERRRYHSRGDEESRDDNEREVTELQAARASFWTPTITTDAFGNLSREDLDVYSLLVTSSVDALGNRTSTKWNYLHLQPTIITDANGNRKATLQSPFGEVAATAAMGKPGELVGDSLDGFGDGEDLPQAVMDDFYKNPTQSSALALIGSASQRVFRNRIAYRSVGAPTWQATLSRVRHVHHQDQEEEEEGDDEVVISFTFFDGEHRPLQTSLRLRDDAWKVNVSILDTDGQEVVSYQPSIQPSHVFVHPSTSTVHSLDTVSFFDAQDRLVGRLHADHTWTKTVLTPWGEVIYDANDVALVEDPSQDADVGHTFRALNDDTLYQPTWFRLQQKEEKTPGAASFTASAVAKQVALSANTPQAPHKDALGRVILTEDRNCASDGTSIYSLRTTYGVYGTAACVVRDSMKRLAEVIKVDMVGRTTDRVGADYGRRTTLLDVQGNEVRTWSGGGISTRKTYDALRRLKERWVAETDGSVPVEEKMVEELTYGEEIDGDFARERNLVGVVCEHLDQAGRVRVHLVDFKGNVTRSSRQLATEFRKTIDWSSNEAVVQLEDEIFKHEAQFDALNRMTLHADSASGCKTKRVYNASGQVSEIHLRGRDGRWARLGRTEYDSHGRETLIEHGPGGDGAKTTTTTSLEYDPQSLALSRKRIIVASSPDKSKRKSTNVILNETYHRDCLRRIVHQTDDSQLDIWHANNRVRPDKTFAYDALGRLIRATGRAHERAGHSGAGIMTENGAKSLQPGPEALYEYVETYSYNDAGNLLSLKHESAGNTPTIASWTRKYWYEEESCLSGASVAALASAFPSVHLGYDNDNDDASSAKPPPVNNNRLTRTQVGRLSEIVHYDKSTLGGVHGCPSSLSRWSFMTWNYDAMLRSSAASRTVSPSAGKKVRNSSARTWYVYDASGHRVRKVTERGNHGGKLKETIYLEGVDVFRRFSPALTPSAPPSIKSERVTVHGKGSHAALVELWADKDGTERSLLRHQVHHGVELDEGGNTISREEYSPFGRAVFSVRSRRDITAPRRYRFAGYQRDLETGLYYCNARYYAPWLGRWLSSDPMYSADGLDTYAYCGNDPVNHFDQTGTMKKFNFASVANLQVRAQNVVSATQRPQQVRSAIGPGQWLRNNATNNTNNINAGINDANPTTTATATITTTTTTTTTNNNNNMNNMNNTNNINNTNIITTNINNVNNMNNTNNTNDVNNTNAINNVMNNNNNNNDNNHVGIEIPNNSPLPRGGPGMSNTRADRRTGVDDHGLEVVDLGAMDAEGGGNNNNNGGGSVHTINAEGNNAGPGGPTSNVSGGSTGQVNPGPLFRILSSHSTVSGILAVG
ncbi:virulence plasmid 65kDa B protein-domain-containing protein [Podospora aff. communis PSN243]|uniref:Virulence plasmid 65kDa B protein-domain-containing protein n=1 Tax=Podospora aff. communis PSN243 TaxID=3040156 RepID=A0AAV9H3T0_9PEZI|nr:virulence plasmid 65kDa B protein-domain-containing protein [Podospora aff. communis PSN243]